MKPTIIDDTLHMWAMWVWDTYLRVTIASWNHAAGKDVLLIGIFATKFLKYKNIVSSQGLVSFFVRFNGK